MRFRNKQINKLRINLDLNKYNYKKIYLFIVFILD